MMNRLIGVAVLALVFITSIVHAQSSNPEDLRATLRAALETQQEVAAMAGIPDAQEIIAQALKKLDQLTEEDLALFEGMEGQFLEMQDTQDALHDQLKVLKGYIPNLAEVIQQSTQLSSSATLQESLATTAATGLTDADYGSICSSNPFGSPANGPNRSDSDTNQGLVTAITVSDTALVVAEGVRDAADVVCNTVAVVAGFGGNPQNVGCTITAGTYIAAKVINDGLKVSFRLLTFCDATIDGAEIEGAFERASNIYDQNVDIDADLAAHDADLAAHDADIKALLAKIQESVDANREKLDHIIKLLLTPQGRRPGFKKDGFTKR